MRDYQVTFEVNLLIIIDIHFGLEDVL